MVMITPYCMTNFLITSLSVFFSSQLSFLFRCCCNQNITPLIPSWLCFWFNFTAEHHTHNVLLNRNTVISLWENLKRYICVYDFTTYVLKSGPLIWLGIIYSWCFSLLFIHHQFHYKLQTKFTMRSKGWSESAATAPPSSWCFKLRYEYYS